MRFVKMHGTGNDYVYVDLWEENVPDPVALAIEVSHRHFGIGSDGLILVAPPDAEGFAGRMIMFNADGSESGMCGNGLRCVAKFLFDRGRSGGATEFRLQTGAGARGARIHVGPDGKAERVTLSMGQPILESGSIPTTLPGGQECEIEVAGRILRGTPVGMGNPHFVVFVDDVDAYPVQEIGSLLEVHPAFPRRVNIEFVQVVGQGHLRQRTWERGSGETWACGTGASAVCVASRLRGVTDGEVEIDLLGGRLTLSWDGQGEVQMTGNAVEVFRGEI
ncbi:MAG: diaminopimelate epimerase [Fibrobacteria bacterium]|nr:diaminopimelate epimerase [Fibrobacteria bacterium]